MQRTEIWILSPTGAKKRIAFSEMDPDTRKWLRARKKNGYDKRPEHYSQQGNAQAFVGIIFEKVLDLL